MAKNSKYSVSVILPSTNVPLMVGGYLSKVLEFMSRQNEVDDYEVIVVDSGKEDFTETFSIDGVRYIKANAGSPMARTLNYGIFNARCQLLLILCDSVLPQDDYFQKTIPLFSKATNVFGVSAIVYDYETKTPVDQAYLPDIRFGTIGYRINFGALAPTYTFRLSMRNVLVDRQKIGLMGGFQNIFDLGGYVDMDTSLRAWRNSWKCIFTPETSCRKTEQTQRPSLYRADSALTNEIILNYLHTKGFKHAKFFCMCVTLFLASTLMNSVRYKGLKNSCKMFFRRIMDAHEIRTWNYSNIHTGIKDVVDNFFTENKGLQIDK